MVPGGPWWWPDILWNWECVNIKINSLQPHKQPHCPKELLLNLALCASVGEMMRSELTGRRHWFNIKRNLLSTSREQRVEGMLVAVRGGGKGGGGQVAWMSETAEVRWDKEEEDVSLLIEWDCSPLTHSESKLKWWTQSEHLAELWSISSPACHGDGFFNKEINNNPNNPFMTRSDIHIFLEADVLWFGRKINKHRTRS